METPLLQTVRLKSSSSNPLSGNQILGAMVDWQLSMQENEINIAGSVARNLDEPLEAKFKISHQLRNRAATFGIGITGLDNPVRLVTPNIDLDIDLEYVFSEVLWYLLPYDLRNILGSLSRNIDSLFWDHYHYYYLTKIEIAKMLSGTLFSRSIFLICSKIKSWTNII